MRALRSVHLVRHGEVENPAGISYGRLPGFRLSALGRRQADGVARRFAGRFVGALLTSPLERAVETASIVGASCMSTDPTIDPRLIEIGSWRDGLPRRVTPVAYAKQYFDKDVRRRAEPAREVVARMRAAIDDALALDAEAVVLVTHQSPIWLVRASFERTHLFALADVAPWLLARAPCDTGSITTLRFDATRRLVGVEYEPPRVG